MTVHKSVEVTSAKTGKLSVGIEMARQKARGMFRVGREIKKRLIRSQTASCYQSTFVGVCDTGTRPVIPEPRAARPAQAGRALRILAAIVVGGGSIAALAMPAYAATTVVVSGAVRDGSGAGLANVAVSATIPPSNVVATDLTAGDGTYSLSVPSGTALNLSFNPPASDSLGQGQVLGRVFTTDTSLDIVLVPSAVSRMSGVVRDSAGNPVGGEQVALVVAGTSTTVAGSTTGGNGAYSLQATPGQYQLWVDNNQVWGNDRSTVSHFNVKSQPFNLTGSLVQDLTIPYVSYDVSVVDGSGAPVVGASVTMPAVKPASFDLFPGNSACLL